MDRMSVPHDNEEYGLKEYWDSRYRQEPDGASFDWFKSYSDLRDLIEEFIPDKSSKIIMLGCGNSKLSEDMWQNGHKDITNIDYSSVVIEQMSRRHASLRPEMKWFEMDVRNLSFEDGSFDVAIDKGTMDAILTAKGDVWDPPSDVVKNCQKEIKEATRVLRKGGIFMYITFGQPHFRRHILALPGFSLQIREIGEAFHYYIYILTCEL